MNLIRRYIEARGAIASLTVYEIYDALKGYDSTTKGVHFEDEAALGDFLCAEMEKGGELEVRAAVVDGVARYSVGLRKTLSDSFPKTVKPSVITDRILGKRTDEVTDEDRARERAKRQAQGDTLTDPALLRKVKVLAGVRDEGEDRAEYRGDEGATKTAAGVAGVEGGKAE